MSAPWQALAAVGWAVLGPPLLVYAATRVRRGEVSLHGALMATSIAIELGVVAGFSFLMDPSPRRAELAALPIFTVHLAFAFATLGGIGWQLLSRIVPVLRPFHRHTGPYVVLVWCLALITGIYNFVFLYVLR